MFSTPKRIPLLLFIIFVIANCFSQQKPLDSVHQKTVDSLIRLSSTTREYNLDSALIISRQALAYSVANNYLKGIAQSYSSIGVSYSYLNDEGMALFYMKKSLRSFEKLQDQDRVNTIRFNVAATLVSLESYEEAEIALNNCHDYYLNTKDTLNLASTFYVKGIIDDKLNRKPSVIKNTLQKALEMASAASDTLLMNQSLGALGRIAIEKENNAKKGLAYLKRAERIILKHDPNDIYTLGFTFLELSRAYLFMNQLTKALSYNDKALKAHQNLNFLYGLSEIYKTRKVIFEKMGRYESALEAAKMMDAQKDSLQKEDMNRQASMMKVEYETERIQAEKETALANAKLAKVESKKNQAYFIGASLIGILILVSAFLYVTRLKASKKSALMAAELAETQKRLHIEKKYKESELKALKSQMNPHFIFNALNSIQEYIITNKKNEASDYLGRFSDLIRRYLNQSNAKGISLAEEMESLKLYLEIEALRFENDFEYQVIYEDELRESEVEIPSMMVQPYVENAIRHGLLHKKGIKKLSVYFVIKENTVICKIKDNGVGRKRGMQLRQKRNAAHKSFADKATKDRLELFNSEAKRKAGVDIVDLFINGEPSGTKVILSIPII